MKFYRFVLFFFLSLNLFGLPKTQAQFAERKLVITFPELLNTDDYRHTLSVLIARNQMPVRGAGFGDVIRDNKTRIYDIWNDFHGKFSDSLIEITFTIRKFSARGSSYQHVKEILNINHAINDTLKFEIPPLPSLETLVPYFQEENKQSRKKYLKTELKDDIVEFFSDMDSRLLYISYYQGHRAFGELMFGPAQYLDGGRHLQYWPIAHIGPTVGTEFNFNWRKDQFILGPKIGFQFSTFFVNAGLHFVYYTDFDRGCLYFKPRIGINPLVSLVNISYSYAVRLGPDYFGNRVNQHQLCLNFIIPLVK